MIRAFAVVCSFVGASAFAPSRVSRSSSAIKMAFETAEGAQVKIVSFAMPAP